MTSECLDQHIDTRGVVRLTMNRPDVKNALDEPLITRLSEAVVTWARSPEARVIIITGAGDAFCAGTDVSWMEELATEQPSVDARRLGNLLWQIRNAPKPTIARVNGAAMGAGLALAVACDIAVADDTAQFSLPAVRLGSAPAVLTPFLLEAVSPAQLRRFALTGEVFEANDARRIGFVHATCLGAQLDATVDGFVENLILGGPVAQKEIKALLNVQACEPLTPNLIDNAAKISARIRRSPEALEGLAAFIEKRRPDWLD